MSETKGGADLVAALQKKTGQTPRDSRPGWSFTLDGESLGPNVRPDEPDPFTPEQRERGVELDFVHLTLREQAEAEGRAGARFELYGGSMVSSPMALPAERARLALWRVDGKPIGDDDARDRIWEAIGETGRAVCMNRYSHATSGGGALGKAVKRAEDSFRVRA